MKYKDFKNMDFDYLVALNNQDPAKYELEVREMLDDFIGNHIECEKTQIKMKQLQWSIDGKLRGYKDPVARLNKMVELFWEGFQEFKESMDKFK